MVFNNLKEKFDEIYSFMKRCVHYVHTYNLSKFLWSQSKYIKYIKKPRDFVKNPLAQGDPLAYFSIKY